MATHDRGDNVSKTISMTKEMHSGVLERMESLGIPELSKYLQTLIREDLIRRGVLERSEVRKSAATKRKR